MWRFGCLEIIGTFKSHLWTSKKKVIGLDVCFLEYFWSLFEKKTPILYDISISDVQLKDISPKYSSLIKVFPNMSDEFKSLDIKVLFRGC